MEILDLRHFSAADLRPLLEEEIATWAKLLAWDYAGSAEMILRYMDAKILPGYAAIERGSIFGYAFFVYEQSKGVIGDLFVHDGGRSLNRREVEERLAHSCHRDAAAIARHPPHRGAIAGASRPEKSRARFLSRVSAGIRACS